MAPKTEHRPQSAAETHGEVGEGRWPSLMPAMLGYLQCQPLSQNHSSSYCFSFKEAGWETGQDTGRSEHWNPSRSNLNLTLNPSWSFLLCCGQLEIL